MLKIMIVDNEAAIRKGLAHCIKWEMLGCMVSAQAEDGIDALEQIAQTQPDIVISDIRMPGMDGLTLAQRLNEAYPQIKTIILTGFPDFEYAQRAISYQVVDFVLKPTSVNTLTRAVEKAKAQIIQERSRVQLKQALADKNEQNLQLERGMLLHDLIHRIDLSNLFVLNRCAQLDMQIFNFYVLHFDIVPISEQEQNQTLSFVTQVHSVLADCFSQYTIYFAPHGDHMGFAVVCTQETHEVETLCREAVDIISSFPQFTLYIGISQYYQNVMDMAQAAEEACQAVRFAEYSEGQTVVCYQTVPAIPPDALDKIYELLRLLKAAMSHENFTGAQQMVKQLFTLFREYAIAMEEIRNICLYAQQFCASIWLTQKEALPKLTKLFDDMTVDRIEQTMLEYIAMLPRSASNSPDDIRHIIHTVKNYVTQHYQEEISLESLAALVYLSPSYLSKVFKRETGENLSNYIQEVRIQEAKTLLRSTSLKAYEVAQRVGIPDPVYFARIFKKVTGIKPKDFRASEQAP